MELRIDLSSLSPPAGHVRKGSPREDDLSDPERYFTGWLELLKVLDAIFSEDHPTGAS